MIFSQNRSTATWAYLYCKRMTSFTALYQTVTWMDVPRLTTITVILFVRVFIARFRYLATSPSSFVPVILLYSEDTYYHYQSKHSLSTGLNYTFNRHLHIKRSARLFKIISVYRCSIPHAYFIPYAYGMCHMRIRVWYNYTRMVQLYAYGILFYTIYVYEDSFWFMHIQ